MRPASAPMGNPPRDPDRPVAQCGPLVSAFASDGETIFRHACALGAEGLVARRQDKPYRSGRCADWVKIKNPTAPAAVRQMEC